MTQTDKSWWEQMQAKGRGWFILREGILRHGLRVGVCLVLVEVVFLFLTGQPQPPIGELVLTWALLTLWFGAFIGMVLWKQHERDHRKPSITGSGR